MVKAWILAASCLLFACTERFESLESHQDSGVAGAAGIGSTDSIDDSGSLVQSTGGSSSLQSTGGASSVSTTSVAGQSSVASSSSTGGNSSIVGSSSTGGANASTGGSSASIAGSSSTGGAFATGGTTFVDMSNSVPQTTVLYVVRYSIENAKTMWPNFRVTYFNRSNKASTMQTINCGDFNSGKGMECRFTVNQALAWELSACINADCTYTLPQLDASGICTIESGLRVYRSTTSGLTEIDSRLIKNQTNNGCNLVIDPGGVAPTNTLDRDGDSVIDANDPMPKNPSVHPKIVSTDREICGNDLDEDCDGKFDNGDCGNVVPPASTGSVSPTLRAEVHWLLPNKTGVTFASTVAELVEIEPTYQAWPCQETSVADFVTGNFIQGVQCAIERDPTKEFVYQVRVGSLYLAGYSCANPTTCLTHSFRDYVTVGGFPYAALDDGQAGFQRSITLRYDSSADTVRAVVPLQ